MYHRGQADLEVPLAQEFPGRGRREFGASPVGWKSQKISRPHTTEKWGTRIALAPSNQRSFIPSTKTVRRHLSCLQPWMQLRPTPRSPSHSPHILVPPFSKVLGNPGPLALLFPLLDLEILPQHPIEASRQS